jgi:hypothetical protein
MGHTISIDLPDDLYATLRSQAERAGKPLEQFVADRLLSANPSPDQDDLLKLAGSLHSDVTDIADRHDHYIGERLAQKLIPDGGE